MSFPKNSAYLVDPESGPRRVIRTILNVYNEELVTGDALFRRQLEKLGAIEAILLRVEVLAVKFKEFLQVLGKSTEFVYPKTLQIRRRHQNNRVGTEASRIRFVQIVFSKQLFYY